MSEKAGCQLTMPLCPLCGGKLVYLYNHLGRQLNCPEVGCNGNNLALEAEAAAFRNSKAGAVSEEKSTRPTMVAIEPPLRLAITEVLVKNTGFSAGSIEHLVDTICDQFWLNAVSTQEQAVSVEVVADE